MSIACIADGKKGTSRDKATLNSENVKLVALSVFLLLLLLFINALQHKC